MDSMTDYMNKQRATYTQGQLWIGAREEDGETFAPVLFANGPRVAKVDSVNVHKRDANARRFVALWNEPALFNLSTEALEQGAVKALVAAAWPILRWQTDEECQLCGLQSEHRPHCLVGDLEAALTHFPEVSRA